MNYLLLIDGEWVPAINKKSFKVTNPANGEVIGTVADGSADDAIKAIDAADRAFPVWAAKTAKERANILHKACVLMRERIDELARVLTLEQGKPLTEAKGEIMYAADFVEWYAEEAKRIYGEIIPASHPAKRLMVLRQPVGVVAAITPWNFPAAMITRKLAPALAAGCTMVIKPAEETPLTACKLMEIFIEAGVPAGVVNLVTGKDPQAIGQVLLSDPRVRKVTFTGSTEVGKLVMRQAADTVKKISLELGGHAPFIIFEDADIDTAAEQLLASKFRNAGQTCICTNRIYVHEQIADDFVEVFAKKVQQLKVGDGLSGEVDIGPLINEQALEKVNKHVQDAIAKGAKLVTGGKRIGGHLYYEPTVLCHVTDEMLIQQEETFGPVAPIQTFEEEKEVIQKANHTPYGLAAYLFTKDLARAFRVAEALEYGIVGVNDGLPSAAQAPFGGMKESGIGREGGKAGIEEYLELKYISVGGII
ncbi:NAD-dependent succinate-semialdehyde dehydrogenase [Thermoflavimicrobium dichotomicum]|uniref:Aldehyde dehydrogenase n=1 Tax=Thermoflavimicrobium dichotomicum TaxID=46223 RepID=A0A1I3JZM7_9BACL|nr:NAD-dependent succinate-semialdehyde dehydrogenase [Thermoflavimicrobium dichotomicum]SFI65520.1 succinate-semialdehyde dehydrogenase / glutarate-semialdehyde dehydrogenase [Thermoflavimicrobium dichotomicum]